MLIFGILILSPLAGFLLNALFPWKRRPAVLIGCASSFISFLSTLWIWKNYSGSAQTVRWFSWIQWDKLEIDFSFLIDPLSLTMASIVTGVGFLIHIFSVEYMSQDSRIRSYFSYLNLFLFSMLILVLADNLLLLFVGWEGVGLCSYLLIGFWFTKREKAVAGMKAFIVNRIGDAAFLASIFLFFTLFQSLNFSDMHTEIVTPSLALWTCLLMFLGAAGKSAQLPFYVWLPSAMAGPTPVSALIHAATMVTAGVYLIIRTSELWLVHPWALNVVAIVGTSTAILGAYLGCKAWDVKKVLAYSTISQLGYMFLALGVGAFSSALFHLTTHAFFKACLFLSAGSLIHGLNGEQDIRKMGELRKKMPFTFLSFLIGSLALMGLPFFSGFFSKDEILYHTFHEGHYFLWLIAVLGAGLTAFYTTKVLYYVFWKKAESSQDKVHESGWWMKIPLLILSLLSVVAGALNWPHFMPKIIPYGQLAHWIHPSQPPFAGNITMEIILASISAVFVLSIAIITLLLLSQNRPFLPWLFKPQWSLDEFYQKYFVQGTNMVSQKLFQTVETKILQGGIHLIQNYFLSLKNSFAQLQNGLVQNYALFMGLGLLIFVLTILLR